MVGLVADDVIELVPREFVQPSADGLDGCEQCRAFLPLLRPGELAVGVTVSENPAVAVHRLLQDVLVMDDEQEPAGCERLDIECGDVRLPCSRRRDEKSAALAVLPRSRQCFQRLDLHRIGFDGFRFGNDGFLNYTDGTAIPIIGNPFSGQRNRRIPHPFEFRTNCFRQNVLFLEFDFQIPFEILAEGPVGEIRASYERDHFISMIECISLGVEPLFAHTNIQICEFQQPFECIRVVEIQIIGRQDASFYLSLENIPEGIVQGGQSAHRDERDREIE